MSDPHASCRYAIAWRDREIAELHANIAALTAAIRRLTGQDGPDERRP